jgi:beta-aspartyl-dipeptidase (metallo-type)
VRIVIKLIKGAKVFAPKYLGIKDILIVDDKIAAIENSIILEKNSVLEIDIIDGKGKIITPGFIDCHVHITGGGGEGGFKTRTPEIRLTDITKGGVTTVVGTLGTDGITRTVEALFAKAKSLEEEGITTFIYSGSYRVPVITITGDIMKDLIVVDKVIGVGEIALSDHRSSQPSVYAIKNIAAQARVGGILSGKAGVVNIHMGDGKDMLNMLFYIVENTEIPFTQFLPTHINRNPCLFEEGIRYAKAGGYIDFTTSSVPVFWEEGEIKASIALKRCLEAGVDESRIVFSSDGQGSLPIFNEKKEFVGLGIGKVTSLFAEVKDAILKEGVPMEKALKVITTNPATILKLKGKGAIKKGYDADIVLLDESNLNIDTVIAKGQTMILNKEIKVFGTFEC